MKALAKLLLLIVVWISLISCGLSAQNTNQAAPAGQAPVSAVANNQPGELALGNDEIYKKSLAALTMLLVVAVLLESAFSTLFNWRVFLTYFSLRGIKTIIMVVVAYAVVTIFDIDVVANLIAQYKSPPAAPVTGVASKFITALILAGGSAGVYNIMAALGFRNARRELEVVPKPPNDKAWFSVRVKRQNAVGPVMVRIQSLGPVAAYAGAPMPIAGVIGFQRPSIVGLLFRNVDRFPQNGGYTLLTDTVYEIVVEGKDATGQLLSAPGGRCVFAAGAIVDFEVTL